MDFELNRKDLHDSRFIAVDRPSPANGEAMNYWAFVPASDPGWGKLNVWGYAHVEESRHPDLAEGMRVYGYLPCASHLLVVPDRIDAKGFVDDVARLPGERAVYVDVSGDGAVRTAVHGHYGDRLAHSAAVGMTHWTEMAKGSTDLEGPSPVFFFAPDRIKKRGADWGTAQLDRNVADAWAPFARWASAWLRVDSGTGTVVVL